MGCLEPFGFPEEFDSESVHTLLEFCSGAIR
jgi:hypothetical protein